MRSHGRGETTAPESERERNDQAAVALALPSGTSVGGVTTWSIEMARQVATLTSRRSILLEHPSADRGLVDTSTITGVDVVKCGALLHAGATEANVQAYRTSLPAVFVPNFGLGTYATCAALSRQSADQMRVIGFCHTDDASYFDMLRYYEPIIHRFVAVSSKCFGQLQALLPHRAADIVMRSYGVRVPDRLERTYSAPGQPIQLLYAGRIVEAQKCVSDLLSLARELTRQGVDYRLCIVGEGPDKHQLIEQHEMLDPDTRARVEVHPGVSPAEMPAILRAADVAVLVSAYEGTSIFMLEALAQGCVPVVTHVSGTNDVIDNNVNGAYVEVGDIAGLAREIAKLDSDRARLATQGRRAHVSAAEYGDGAYFRWFAGLCDDVWLRGTPRAWPAHLPIEQFRPSFRQRVATTLPWARPAYRWIARGPLAEAIQSTRTVVRERTTHRPARFRIFFIRGYMRSGTNWVGNLLNLHPQVLSTGEFHLDRVRGEFDQLLRRGSPVSAGLLRSGTKASFESWTRQCVMDGVPWREKLSAVWLGDRTPARLEPLLIEGAPSILVVRDGRDVLVSRTYHLIRRNGIGGYPFDNMPGMRGKRDAFLEDPACFIKKPHELLDDEQWVRASARAWADHVAADRQTLNRISASLLDAPVLAVRYEELHADTLGWQAQMLGFLGVDGSLAKPLDDLTAPGFVREDVRSHYRKGAIGDWQRYFTPTVARWFNEEAGEQLVEEGYEQSLDWHSE